MHRRLRQLIIETGAFTHSPEKPFVLASGLTHPYYGMRRLNAHLGELHPAAPQGGYWSGPAHRWMVS